MEEVTRMAIKLVLNRCKGCGICIRFYPKEVLINELSKVEVADEVSCIQCKQCEERCPDYAIFIQK